MKSNQNTAVNTPAPIPYYGGAPSTIPEGYKRPQEALGERQQTADAWWTRPVVLALFTVGFSALDAMVLYSILDEVSLQGQAMGYIMAGGIALILNVIPLLIARFVHQAIYKTKRLALTWAILATLGFFLMFGATVNLRFAFHDMYGGSGAQQLTNTVATSSDNAEEANTEEDATEQKGYAAVILLCIEPLLTSLANFLLAYLSDDELRKRKEHLEIDRLQLQEAITDIKAAIAGVNREEELEVALDKQKLQKAMEEVDAIADTLRANARLYLAQYLANPSSTTKLCHELDVKEAC